MRYHLLVSLLILLFACKESRPPVFVERISLEATAILNDSIESVMPGVVYVSEKYILWTDPFHSDMFMHILEIESGKEVGQMVEKGEGPDQFVAPSFAVLPNDRIFIFDPYTGKTAIQSIQLAIQNESPFLSKQSQELGNVTRVTFTDNEEMISFNPSESTPFTIVENMKTRKFGKLPFKGDVANGYDHFQGSIAYNPMNKHFVYSTMKFPYYAVYKKEGNSFKLKNEILNIEDYSLRDGNFVYKGIMRGPYDLTLTSDYIVTMERDRKFDQTDDSKMGRDFTKLPHTIFLYDYDFQLRKIVDLGMPVLRIAADPINNTLYIIGVNPDFTLYKYIL